MTKEVPPRIHAILARGRSCATVFRRGPSNQVAVIGWDLDTDEFTLGQWLYGRIYEYRCDLSPDGKYLLYFAAKYGRVNPVEARIRELVNAQVGEFDWFAYTEKKYFAYSKKCEDLEMQIRKKYAVELNKLRNRRDYTDASWTAISRTPYLKALDLWFNGSGWNGGGWFVDSSHVWINKPPPHCGEHFYHTRSGKFKELAQAPDLRLERENGGECLGIYLARLERDGWQFCEETETYAKYVKPLPYDLWLIKRFYFNGKCPSPAGYGCYWEEHDLSRGKELLLAGNTWRWADYDAKHKRILFAVNGMIFALRLKTPDVPPALLYDFNDMKYERLPAPYAYPDSM